jgi:hypothetical protein
MTNLLPSATTTVYVRKGGNDTTGDGSFENPLLTISAGMVLVATLPLSTGGTGENQAVNNPVCSVGPGLYVENVALPANINLVGSTDGATQVVGAITIDASSFIAADGGGYSYILNLIADSIGDGYGIILDFNTPQISDCGILLENVTGNQIVMDGYDGSNEIEMSWCYFGETTYITGVDLLTSYCGFNTDLDYGTEYSFVVESTSAASVNWDSQYDMWGVDPNDIGSNGPQNLVADSTAGGYITVNALGTTFLGGSLTLKGTNTKWYGTIGSMPAGVICLNGAPPPTLYSYASNINYLPTGPSNWTNQSAVPTCVSNALDILSSGNYGPPGHFATNGCLNFTDNGNLLSARNSANTSNINLMSIDGSNNITIGDMSYAANINIEASQPHNITLNAGGNWAVLGVNGNPGYASITNTVGNVVFTMGETGFCVPTGASIACQGNGPVAQYGEVKFSATGVLAAFRNAANTSDRRLIAVDGSDNITFGNHVGGNTTIYGNAQITVANNTNNTLVATGSNTALSGNPIQFINSGTEVAQIDGSGLTIENGYYLSMPGGGHASQSGEIRFNTQSIYMSLRNNTNTGDIGLASSDGFNNVIFGDGTNANNATVAAKSLINLTQGSTSLVSVGQYGLGLANASVSGTTGTITLTAAQYLCPMLTFTGTLTANITYVFPNAAGTWICLFPSTWVGGTHTATMKSGTGSFTIYSGSGSLSMVIVSTGGSNTIYAII